MSSGRECQGTPAATDSNKRDLSSPFDPNETKKARALSENSDMDESITQVRLSDADLVRISSLLQKTFQSELKTMVADVIEGVMFQLSNKVDALETENSSLKSKIKDLECRLDDAETRSDSYEQYSRRNSIRISGVRETPEESTDQIAINIAKSIGADLTISEIDRSHRVGRIRTKQDAESEARIPTSKPRDILVKFVSYGSRAKLLLNKKNLKGSEFDGVFLNEDLTRTRSLLFQQARQLVKTKLAKGAWTSDGTIVIKSHNDTRHRVESMAYLVALKPKLPPPTSETY